MEEAQECLEITVRAWNAKHPTIKAYVIRDNDSSSDKTKPQRTYLAIGLSLK